MLEDWIYHNPVKICFGTGTLSKLPFCTGSDKAVLITTPGMRKRGVVDHIKALLGPRLQGVFSDVTPNPTFYSINDAFRHVSLFRYKAIIALGGGSVIDTAKASAAIEASGNDKWVQNHLKKGAPFPEPFNPKPIIAVPTTAGTGSEVTMWATIWDMKDKKKYSLAHPTLFPSEAILDPDLTLSLPKEETTYSGLDALSHAMEAIWNKNANPLSDEWALKAIAIINRDLPSLIQNLSSSGLRTRLLFASLCAGLAFSNTKTALAHSLSYPLTAHFGLPHGLACALPLPHLLEFNGSRRFDRIKGMANALDTPEDLEAMVESLKRFFGDIQVPLSLARYGVALDHVDWLTARAFTPGRAENNIVDLEQNELRSIVKRLF